MRYDTKVTFCKETPGGYNPATGDYAASTVRTLNKWANVTDAGADAMQLIYGQLRQGAIVIRIRGAVDPDMDYIMVGGKKYSPDMVRTLRQEQTFTCSEVQS